MPGQGEDLGLPIRQIFSPFGPRDAATPRGSIRSLANTITMSPRTMGAMTPRSQRRVKDNFGHYSELKGSSFDNTPFAGESINFASTEGRAAFIQSTSH